jgi:hypothetical protein
MRRIIVIGLGLTVVVVTVAFLLRLPSSSSSSSPASTQHPVVIDGSRLSFPGATGWTEEPCAGQGDGDVCLGQWAHDAGQVARVLLLPLPDPSKLDTLAERLRQQTEASGGVAERVDGGAAGTVIRLLQPMKDADHQDAAIVAITYVVAAPDRRSIHLLTSSAPLPAQEAADARVRDLLAFGVWEGSDDAEVGGAKANTTP